MQNALVASVAPNLLSAMSQSASESQGRRRKGETTNIDKSVQKARERIAEIDQEMEKAEEELELWQAELDKLQGDLDNISLDELEQLEEDKQRLEQYKIPPKLEISSPPGLCLDFCCAPLARSAPILSKCRVYRSESRSRCSTSRENCPSSPSHLKNLLISSSREPV